jgi:transmembrane sensor
MDEEAKQRREDLSQEAALWVVRLAEPDAPSSLVAEFEAWRAQGPEHEVAFERERRTWEKASALREVGGERRRAGALRPAAPGASAGSSRRELFRQAAAAAGVAVLAGGAGTAAFLATAGRAYATAVGERRLVVLEDGSRIEMNTDTRLVVRYSSGRRAIRLEQGEALFEVAPNKARPFVVVAGEHRVQALGTAFNVRTRDEGMEVLVSHGVVAVGPDGFLDQGADQRLTAGMSGRFGVGRTDISYKASPAEIERTLAWRRGTIVLNGETLDQAVAEFNRYNTRQLEVADPAIAKLKLGGYFQANDLDNFTHALRSSFGIVAAQGADQRLYLSKAR